MKKSDQLKLERTAKVTAQKEIIDLAKAENRDFKPEEQTRFDALNSEIAELDTNIQRALNVEAAELRAAELEGTHVTGAEQRNVTAEEPFSLNRAIRSLVNGTALTGAELAANNRGAELARNAGVGVNPSSFVMPMFDTRSVQTRADGQTVTADSGAYGGNTVATDVLSPIDYLRPRPVVESLGAVLLTGLQGNLQFPKNNGGVTATWEDEDADVGNTKTAWGKIELKPRRLAVSVPISLQNLMQSSFDMEAYTMGEIRKAIENEIDKDALYAILDSSDVNSVAIGTNGGALTFAKAVSAVTSSILSTTTSDADAVALLSFPILKLRLSSCNIFTNCKCSRL